jgi:hypothetical protein
MFNWLKFFLRSFWCYFIYIIDIQNFDSFFASIQVLIYYSELKKDGWKKVIEFMSGREITVDGKLGEPIKYYSYILMTTKVYKNNIG